MSFFAFHKIKKPFARPAAWFALLILSTTALTAVAPFLPSVPQAQARNEEYVFYYPDDKELIKQLQDAYKADGSPEDVRARAELAQTSVWSKGGIWENTPLRMSYNQKETIDVAHSAIGDGLRDHGYVYSATYKCDNNKVLRGNEPGTPDDGYYEVQINRAVKIEVSDSNKFSTQDNYRSRTWIGKITKYGPVPAQTAGDTSDSRKKDVYDDDEKEWISQDKISESGINIAACLPSYTFGDESVSNTPNYYRPSPREADWPGLVDADIARRSGSSTASQDDQPNCQNTGSPLGVVICPFIEGVAGASDWIYSTFIEALLTNVPIGNSPSDPAFTAWQSFRILGNIILVGALLAMVFAQSFGERFIDAYALRKMAPRILVGAIAINLSIYLALAAIDVTEIIGRGMGNLLTRPFVGGDGFNFTLGDSNALLNLLELLGVVGAAAGGAGVLFLIVRGVFGTRTNTDGSVASRSINNVDSGTVLMWVLLFIVIPIALIALAVLITLVIRQGLLILLVILAPIAFACYVLPGTEKYFRTWWSLFSKTLMIFPIIAAIFALSDIMSTLIFRANESVVGLLTGTIVMFLPLVLIPFSFKFAGGALGTIFSAATNAGTKMNGLANGNRQRTGARMKSMVQQGRIRAIRDLSTPATRDIGAMGATGMRRRRMQASKGLAKMGRFGVQGLSSKFNVDEAEAAINEAGAKRVGSTTSRANDDVERAVTVNRQLADQRFAEAQAAGALTSTVNDDGQTIVGTAERRVNTATGQVQYSTASGDNWVSLADVKTAESTYGDNAGEKQEAWRYEMTKSTRNEQKQSLIERMGDSVKSGQIADQDRIGIWKGAGFQMQNEDLFWKHSTVNPDGTYSLNSNAVRQEIFEKKGSYPTSSFGQSTIEVLEDNFLKSGAGALEHQNVTNDLATIHNAIGPGGTPTAAQQAEIARLTARQADLQGRGVLDHTVSADSARALDEHKSIARTFQSRLMSAGQPGQAQVGAGTQADFAGSAGSGATNDALIRYYDAVAPPRDPPTNPVPDHQQFNPPNLRP
jgi:hypothetical protein